jgi:hypothetical protein
LSGVAAKLPVPVEEVGDVTAATTTGEVATEGVNTVSVESVSDATATGASVESEITSAGATVEPEAELTSVCCHETRDA